MPRTPYLVSRIRRDLEAKGMIPADLQRFGLTKGTISRFMTGKVQSPRTAKRIAEALGVPIDRYLPKPRSVA